MQLLGTAYASLVLEVSLDDSVFILEPKVFKSNSLYFLTLTYFYLPELGGNTDALDIVYINEMRKVPSM